MAQALKEKLNILGLLKRKEWPQREQLARTPEPHFPKGKGTETVCSEHQIMRGRVKVGEICTLMSEREIRARA